MATSVGRAVRFFPNQPAVCRDVSLQIVSLRKSETSCGSVLSSTDSVAGQIVLSCMLCLTTLQAGIGTAAYEMPALQAANFAHAGKQDSQITVSIMKSVTTEFMYHS